jgi:hypothetical protein
MLWSNYTTAEHAIIMFQVSNLVKGIEPFFHIIPHSYGKSDTTLQGEVTL